MSSQEDKDKKSRNSARYLALTGIAAQMGVTIVAGGYLGKYLDGKYPNDKQWFTIGVTLFSVAVALYVVLKQVNRLNQKDENNR
ncbi:MAG: AtpZ/AtpI family protein [Fluviicola sp.]